jgi:dipeptidase E
MKLLLTSAGIKNDSIRHALVDLLGKPIAESSALCIPTGTYAMPGGAAHAWRLISGVAATPLCEVGWKSLGVLELTALPSIAREQWVPTVQETDALLVGGGDALYLCYWMRQSGLADLLPELPEVVYVGVSAGSMVVTPNFGETYDGWFCREPPASNLPTSDDRALGLVDFSVFPHLDYPSFPENSLVNAEKWAAKGPVPTYAIDDQSAIKVIDGEVSVVSEGHWKRFTP